MELLTFQRKYGEAIALLQTIPNTTHLFAPSDPKALQLANLFRQAGDMPKARPLYAKVLPSVRAEVVRQQGFNLELASVWQSVAYAELGLGHPAQGLDAIAKAQSVGAKVKDLVRRSSIIRENARLYAQARRPDRAVPLLARLLSIPGMGANYAPVLLWIDPSWDPIRHAPRFQALLKQYAKYKPAITYGTPPAS